MTRSDEQGNLPTGPMPETHTTTGANGSSAGGAAKPAAPRRRATTTPRASASSSESAAASVAPAIRTAASPRAPKATPVRAPKAARAPETHQKPETAPLAPAAPRTRATAKAVPQAVPTTPVVPHYGGMSPDNTVFVSLCFEGPDQYSMAGGLGTRVTEFTEALATAGYETHLIFVGDPTEPGHETKINGKLHLKRWSQWISQYHLNGVYDGEDQKLKDYTDTVPQHVYEQIAGPAIAQGKMVVVIGEDWHTAETVSRTSDLLHWHGLRHRAILMWNCNSLMSLHRINWGRLNYTSTITTVSRYMKHRLWQYNVNPLVIPNGIPARNLDPVDAAQVAELREAIQRGEPRRLFLFKIGRFDPDKRWLMAVEAAARLKYSGHPMAMVIRGGLEPHGGEVLSRARNLGLIVKDVEARTRRPTVDDCIQLMRDAGEADIYNLRFFVPEAFVRLCYAAADATLANSGHEPFGLVGLEVMATGGVAFTGSTGEDYAVSFENAVALDSDDPDEIVGYLLHVAQNPDEREKIGAAGRRTAAEFTWEEVIDGLSGKVGFLMRKQGIVLS